MVTLDVRKVIEQMGLESHKAEDVLRGVLDLRSGGVSVYITPEGAAFIDQISEGLSINV